MSSKDRDAAVSLPLGGLGAEAVKSAKDFESFFAGVRKTVDEPPQSAADFQAAPITDPGFYREPCVKVEAGPDVDALVADIYSQRDASALMENLTPTERRIATALVSALLKELRAEPILPPGELVPKSTPE